MDRISQMDFHRKLAVAETPELHAYLQSMKKHLSPELQALSPWSLEATLAYVFGAGYSQTEYYQHLLARDSGNYCTTTITTTTTLDELILIELKKATAEGWVMFGGGTVRL